MLISFLSHVFYLSLLMAFALSLPEVYFDPEAKQFIFLMGFVAAWRYLWAFQHFVRAVIYIYWTFPKLRSAQNKNLESYLPDHMFFLVTSFRISSSVSIQVYRSVVKEAINCGVPCTIVASVVENCDERLAKQIFFSLKPEAHIHLRLIRIAGTGKRDGLAAGFRAVSSTPVDLHKSVVAVVDGDSIMLPGCTRACFGFFKQNPRLGALTTNEENIFTGEEFNTKTYVNWYNLRFAQRHEFMASLALSRRLLTLTGRMSMFRGEIVGDPAFIDRVEFDYIDHWRLGRFRFLTGDDKSTWYHTASQGWDMLYIPDAMIHTIEEPPYPNYFVGATMLMRRWFGNMLRTNARGRKIPRHILGTYTWWVLHDQLISIWTSLFGIVLALMGTFHFGLHLVLVFFFWVLLTRYTLTMALSLLGRSFHLSWPFLMYFNQIYGSLIKAYVLNHLYKQSWTRQKTQLRHNSNWLERWLREHGSDVSFAASLLVFVISLGFIAEVFTMKDVFSFLGAIRVL
ncbi:glycosyltransferase [Algicola sagamiensis]|uniref:glycosyltransferase n=1 Tax=Algicola sagamiensis TaxID=163869 RepID=UPI00036F748D|nr:glycosyltransferase [Algicola sagamiensis]